MCSKEILSYVNQAVRDCENHQKLVDYQRRLDKRSIENSTHPVILEYKVRRRFGVFFESNLLANYEQIFLEVEKKTRTR